MGDNLGKDTDSREIRLDLSNFFIGSIWDKYLGREPAGRISNYYVIHDHRTQIACINDGAQDENRGSAHE